MASARHKGASLWAVLTFFGAAKRVLVGKPFRSDMRRRQTLPKRWAMPVFSANALSSVAYAPDEIILTLALGGVAAVVLAPWVGLAVIVVLLVVVLFANTAAILLRNRYEKKR